MTTKILQPTVAAVLLGGGSVTNAAGGTISDAFAGIALFGPGSVVNAGVVSIASSTRSTGILLSAGGTATNVTGGTVSGAAFGLLSGDAAVLTNQAGALLRGTSYGVFGIKGTSTVTNAGTIIGAGADGVFLGGTLSGSVANSGSIISGSYGVRISGPTSALTNSGTIFSSRTSAGAGAGLITGGSATNAAGGVIAGEWIGMQFGRFGQTGAVATSTFVNYGSVFASDGRNGAAVWMHGPGVIINNASGVIEGDTNGTIVGGPLNGVSAGAFGVVAYYQTTLINRGTIGGTNFAFTAANRNTAISVGNLIEMAPGARFTGAVSGAANTASASLSTLEMLSGASTGVITNFGTTVASAGHLLGYINFGNVTIDNGARWSLGGTVSSATTIGFASGGSGALTLANPTLMQGVITGFSGTETLTLGGITDVTGITLTAGNTLVVTESAGPGLTLRFDPNQNLTGAFRSVVTGAGTDIVSCFAAGTLIRTADHASLPVESLRRGMSVLTHRGEAAEIVWIGHRAVACATHPDPEQVQPIRIRAGAFGPNVPSRDLLLSPDHAVFVAEVLIPARHLVNGTTIRREAVADVTYYHVELPAHDVILAEDLPAESYLDTGDRANFSNGGGPVRLFPGFGARLWEMAGHAPLVTTGPVLERVRDALARGETLIAARKRFSWTGVSNRYTYY